MNTWEYRAAATTYKPAQRNNPQRHNPQTEMYFFPFIITVTYYRFYSPVRPQAL
jgi:hypothetical protein